LHEFGHEAWDTILLCLSVAILNQDVFSLNITEIAQSLPKRIGSGVAGVGAPLPDRYPIRGTFFGCCAAAMTATASSTTALRIDARQAFFIAHPVLDVTYHADGNKEKVIYGERRRVVV
jgi:hypothetical protein